MGITDNQGYVKQAAVGLMGLLVAQSAASAESKFLSLILANFEDIVPCLTFDLSG